MNRYETLLLIRPDVTSDEFSSLEGSIEHLLSENGAKLATFDRWGKYKLMYPVRKNNYGIYALARYEVSDATKEKLLKDISTFFRIKCGDVVMRHVSRQLALNAPMTYKRPESLDHAGESRLDPSVKTFAHGLERKDGRAGRSHHAAAEESQDFAAEQVDLSDDVQA